MKKLSFLFLLSVFAIANACAQIYFSCTHRSIYKYNTYSESFDYIEGYDENSLFEINEDLTMFTHTTPSITSSYYMKNSEFDESTKQLTADVKSDVGNDYYYIFDITNETVKIGYTKNEELYMIKFTVKKIWVDE